MLIPRTTVHVKNLIVVDFKGQGKSNVGAANVVESDQVTLSAKVWYAPFNTLQSHLQIWFAYR